MASLEMNLYSSSLMMDTTLNILLPEKKHAVGQDDGRSSYPVLYLLHGYGDNYSAWMRKSNIEYIARDYDVIVVMPEGNNGFYVNGENGPDYLTYLAEELPQKMARYFPIATERKDTFIMGNSMGGYGAFRAALAYPDRYAAAVSFSGALVMRREDLIFGGDKNGFLRDYILHVGEWGTEQAEKNDLRLLAEKLENGRKEKPRLFHVCGTEDALTYQAGKRFVDFCRKNTSLDLTYLEAEGGHNWGLWMPLIPKAFAFLGLEPYETVKY